MKRLAKAGILLAGVVLLLAVAVVVALRLRQPTFLPPTWEGPAALARVGAADRLCMLLRQEEQRFVFDAVQSRFPLPRTRSFYRFSIRCHDPAGAQPVATHLVAVISEPDGGRVAEARILGQEGEFLWFFLADQPLAIRIADGRLAASRLLLERQFPRLRDTLPAALRAYGFDGGLVFLSAAAEPLRLTLADMRLAPYEAAPDRSAIGRNAQWHGRFATKDFLIRRAPSPERWLGLYTVREAADAAKDEFGDKYRNDAAVFDEGAATRRRWWQAEIGRTREFSEGSHPRLLALRPVGDEETYLGAGLLKQAGQPAPLPLRDPKGWLLVHRTRIDGEGRIVLSRVSEAPAPLWSVTLPVAELTNRWELPGRLLFLGSAPAIPGGGGRPEEYVVSLDLANGHIATWNIGAEAP